MIRPPGFRGAAFSTAADGNGRSAAVQRRLASRLGIPEGWATVRQVHGDRVVVVDGAGLAGDADALITRTPGLPVAVLTADCVPVLVEGDGFVAAIHAGWRGAAAGVVARALEVIADHRLEPARAAIGPAIGPCCYEVGDEVADRFPEHVAATTWDTRSVDLVAAVTAQLDGLDVWTSEACTSCGEDLASHRRNGTEARQVAVAWLPIG